MQISDHRYFEKVFKNLRTTLNIAGDAPVIGIEALKTNVLIRRLFMSNSMNFDELPKLFVTTQKLILDHQAEILNVITIDWTSFSWTSSTLSHDQVITWTKAKVRVYSDSVLCLENVRSFRSESKIGKLSRRNSTVQFFQTMTWN